VARQAGAAVVAAQLEVAVAGVEPPADDSGHGRGAPAGMRAAGLGIGAVTGMALDPQDPVVPPAGVVLARRAVAQLLARNFWWYYQRYGDVPHDEPIGMVREARGCRPESRLVGLGRHLARGVITKISRRRFRNRRLPGGRMRHPTLHALLLRGPAFALLWWVLSEGRHDGWALGAAAVVGATWASLVLSPPGRRRIHPAGLFAFLGFFLRSSIRGGVQVASMALHGRSALQPGLIELQVRLPPGGPRILLVNALTLMPGTLGVELARRTLRLHVLDARLPVVAEARALEAAIARMFGRQV
jgi:multicomponent Na+:H+ antiporter subunit E